MIKEVIYYDIICDRCGKSFSEESNTCYPDTESAVMTAMYSEWRAMGEKHYCPECYYYDDETGNYKPKKGGVK